VKAFATGSRAGNVGHAQIWSISEVAALAFQIAYSGDRDRLRSVQELRCAHWLRTASVEGWSWLIWGPKGSSRSLGVRPRAKPVGTGQDAAPGKRQRVRPKASIGERWVTDAPVGTTGCPHLWPAKFATPSHSFAAAASLSGKTTSQPRPTRRGISACWRRCGH